MKNYTKTKVVRISENQLKTLQKKIYLYCFECEIETKTQENKNGQFYCSQCGLKH